MVNLQNILFKKKQSSINVAVDIGSANLKIAAFSKKEGVVKLNKLLINPINKEDNLPELIKKSFNSLNLNVKSVNISLPTDKVILRYVHMSRMNREELDSSVRFEASKYIPVPLENLFLDPVILKSDCPENKMLVLMVAVKKSDLEERLKLIKDCGLSVRLIDVDSLATINAFNYYYLSAHKKDLKEKESIAILDIGVSSSTLSILQDAIPCFTRSVAIAGNEFDARIGSGLNVSPQEARKARENASGSNNSEVFNILTTAFNDLLNEVRVSFDYFENHFNASVKKIFLLGNVARVFGLKDDFSKSLEIEVIQPDISEGLLFDENLKDSVKENIASLAVALGLGLRDD